MTEEDTFNKLRKPSFNELRNIVIAWRHDKEDLRSVAMVIEENHWDVDEYFEYPNYRF